MKIKILDNFGYQIFPITEDMIEIDDAILKEIGITKQFDIVNKCVINYDNTENLKKTKILELRDTRQIECFPIINRGKLWYDNLTQEQLEELDIWYKAWLNVTETLEEPIKPEWIK